MADDWESESFEPAPLKSLAVSDKWQGEDEEDDVKDNWEDEEEENEIKNDDEVIVKAVQVKKKKSLAEKIEEKERKDREEAARKVAAKEALKNLTPAEKAAERLRQQKLQEEADLQVTKETFGVIETSDSIDALNPTTQDEFNLLEEAIVRKLQPLAGSVHYATFVENLIRNVSVGLNSSNLKKLKVLCDSLYAEKVKWEKEKVKKGGKSKPKVNLERKNDLGGFEDEIDDFDFL